MIILFSGEKEVSFKDHVLLDHVIKDFPAKGKITNIIGYLFVCLFVCLFILHGGKDGTKKRCTISITSNMSSNLFNNDNY